MSVSVVINYLLYLLKVCSCLLQHGGCLDSFSAFQQPRLLICLFYLFLSYSTDTWILLFLSLENQYYWTVLRCVTHYLILYQYILY